MPRWTADGEVREEPCAMAATWTTSLTLEDRIRELRQRARDGQGDAGRGVRQPDADARADRLAELGDPAPRPPSGSATSTGRALDQRRQRLATQLPLGDEPTHGRGAQAPADAGASRLEMSTTIGRRIELSELAGDLEPVDEGIRTSTSTTAGGAEDLVRPRALRPTRNRRPRTLPRRASPPRTPGTPGCRRRSSGWST